MEAGKREVLMALVVTNDAGSRTINTSVTAEQAKEMQRLMIALLEGPAPVAPALGTKENPHDTGAPVLRRGYYTLHPRVLNDYSLPKAFRDEAKRVFTGELKPDYITQVYLSGDALLTEILPNGKGQFYVAYRVPVRCSGWFGGAFVNVSANDLLKRGAVGGSSGMKWWSALVKAERRLYRQWKDAQLKEAKCLTRKRIMKALAGPADAKFKFGDQVRLTSSLDKSEVFTVVGYRIFNFVIILDKDGQIDWSAEKDFTKV